MKNREIAVGLDIGTTKIVAMVGRKNEHGKIEILGVGVSESPGVHRGVVTNIVKTVNSIKEAVEKAEAMSGHKINEVTVGIAGQHIRSLQHSDYITRKNSEDVINEDDLKKLTEQVHKLEMLPGEEIIHVLPQEYKVDNNTEITDPEGMYGSRLEANFHVVVGQITSIKNIVRCVKTAGLTLSGITLEPLASAEATLSCEEKEAGVALIDIRSEEHTSELKSRGQLVCRLLLEKKKRSATARASGRGPSGGTASGSVWRCAGGRNCRQAPRLTSRVTQNAACTSGGSHYRSTRTA